MTERIQEFLLKNTKGLQYIVNERLAKRDGFIGKVFKKLEIGERQYGKHFTKRFFHVVNYFWVMMYHQAAATRPVLGRLFGASSGGPLNYAGFFLWFTLTVYIINRFKFYKIRDKIMLNEQDNPEFWFNRYNMIFPPSFLHNRVSAHYLEINHIFFIEMLKKYIHVRKEILAERSHFSEEQQKTKYITNPNYVFV